MHLNVRKETPMSTDDTTEIEQEQEPLSDDIGINELPDEALVVAERIFGGYQAFTTALDAKEEPALRLAQALRISLFAEDAVKFMDAVQGAREALEELDGFSLSLISPDVRDKVDACLDVFANWQSDDNLLTMVSEFVRLMWFDNNAGRSSRGDLAREAKLTALAGAIRAALNIESPNKTDRRTEEVEAPL
jgi:hypothetical protein